MFRSSALSSSAVAGGVTAAAATEGAVCSDVATSTKGCKATSSDGSPPLQVRNWISQSNKNKFYLPHQAPEAKAMGAIFLLSRRLTLDM